MLGWAIGFFIAAVVAAFFGFGGIASAFTGIAIILFWVFVALFVLSLLFGAFGGGAAAVEGGGGSGRGIGLIALVAVVAIGVYAWMHNGMSAERVGASIDHAATQVADNTSNAVGEVGNRAKDAVHDTSRDLRDGASRN